MATLAAGLGAVGYVLRDMVLGANHPLVPVIGATGLVLLVVGGVWIFIPDLIRLKDGRLVVSLSRRLVFRSRYSRVIPVGTIVLIVLLTQLPLAARPAVPSEGPEETGPPARIGAATTAVQSQTKATETPTSSAASVPPSAPTAATQAPATGSPAAAPPASATTPPAPATPAADVAGFPQGIQLRATVSTYFTGRPLATLEFTNRSGATFVARIDYATFTAVDDTGQRYMATRRDQAQRDIPANGTDQLTVELQPVLAPAAKRLTLQAPALSGVSPFSLSLDLVSVASVQVRPSISTYFTGRPLATLEFTNRGTATFVARIDYSVFTAVDDTGQRYTATRSDLIQRDVPANATDQLTIELQPVLSPAATRLTLQASAFSGVSPFIISLDLVTVASVQVRPSISTYFTGRPLVTLEFMNRGSTNFVARIDYSTVTAVDDTGQRYTAVRRDLVQRDIPANATDQLTVELQPVLATAATRLTLQAPAFSGVSPYTLTFSLR